MWHRSTIYLFHGYDFFWHGSTMYSFFVAMIIAYIYIYFMDPQCNSIDDHSFVTLEHGYFLLKTIVLLFFSYCRFYSWTIFWILSPGPNASLPPRFLMYFDHRFSLWPHTLGCIYYIINCHQICIDEIIVLFLSHLQNLIPHLVLWIHQETHFLTYTLPTIYERCVHTHVTPLQGAYTLILLKKIIFCVFLGGVHRFT